MEQTPSVGSRIIKRHTLNSLLNSSQIKEFDLSFEVLYVCSLTTQSLYHKIPELISNEILFNKSAIMAMICTKVSCFIQLLIVPTVP